MCFIGANGRILVDLQLPACSWGLCKCSWSQNWCHEFGCNAGNRGSHSPASSTWQSGSCQHSLLLCSSHTALWTEEYFLEAWSQKKKAVIFKKKKRENAETKKCLKWTFIAKFPHHKTDDLKLIYSHTVYKIITTTNNGRWVATIDHIKRQRQKS